MNSQQQSDQSDSDPEPLVRQKLGNKWADIMLYMLRQKGDELDQMSEKQTEQMWSIFSLMMKIFDPRILTLSDRIVDCSVKDTESQLQHGNAMDNTALELHEVKQYTCCISCFECLHLHSQLTPGGLFMWLSNWCSIDFDHRRKLVI